LRQNEWSYTSALLYALVVQTGGVVAFHNFRTTRTPHMHIVPQNTEEDPVDPEEAADGDIQMEYSSH
jgi:hypothetical protein